MNKLDFIKTVKIQSQGYLLNSAMSVPKAAEVYDAYCSIHCTDKQLNFNKDKVDE